MKLLRAINGTREHEHFGSSLSIGYPHGRNETGMLAIGLDSVGEPGLENSHVQIAPLI